MTLGVRKMKLLGAAAVAVLAVSASGCSSLPSVPDWVDPTTWFGGDAPADSGETPDLASVPDKPNAVPDDKQQVADSLAADRKNAQCSADALRGGTEPAAAPPPNLPVTPKATAEDETMAPSKKAVVAAPPPPPKAPAVDRSVAQDPSGATSPGTLPATAPGTAAGVLPPPSEVQSSALPEPAPQPVAPPAPRKKVAKAAPAPVPAESAETAPAAPTQVARAEPAPSSFAPPAPARSTQSQLPPGTQPALPPTSSVSPSDAELGFKPSSAPPLDPSVSQFVAAPIVNHYRQTAATSGYVRAPAVASAKKARRTAAVGGPERMSGAVVANLDALQGGRAATPAAYSPASGNATAVVYFPNDTTSLSAETKAQVRAAVEQYKLSGGQGYIRVVGHSSSRTPNMSPEKHVELVFKKSQDRANAVAQEIIRDGVPASKVLVEAVGDTQPVYYESMPKGEDGNRRAEIFLQG